MTPGTPGGRQTAPVSRQVSSGSGGASTGKTILFRIMTGVVISSFFCNEGIFDFVLALLHI